MEILHLSWEYPPLVYGGLGRHVEALARAQVRAGHDVTVVTQTESEPARETVDGVFVVRIPRDLPHLPFDEAHLLAWVAGLEHAMTRAAVTLDRVPDVIHAHDWMVAHAAVTAKAFTGRGVVATFHATEAGRHQGWLPSQLSRSIHSVEWWLAHQATRVVTCSRHMRQEVTRLFDLPEQSVLIIPNGIDVANWEPDAATAHRIRERFAGPGPLVVCTARLEWEKGLHTLLDAMAPLRLRIPGIRLVIAGRGSKEAELREAAQRLRLDGSVVFAGWLPEDELHALVAAADVSVVPSLYEPFGIVALEAAAVGTPVVVSETGGLAEFAENGRVALAFEPGDPESLVGALSLALGDGPAAEKRVRAAEEALREKYSWDLIARQTIAAYESAIESRPVSADLPSSEPPDIPAGNLLRSSVM